MSSINEAVIISAVRTPVGKFLGALKNFKATELGAIAVREAVKRAGVKPEDVDEVIMGCVIQAGLGQNPARQAALKGGLPNTVSAVTVNKVCGSGLKAVMMAAQGVQLGDTEIVVAGGMESMSNAPYLLDRARSGYRMGNGTLVDSMIKDGLWDPYNDVHMGGCAEMCVEKYAFTREEQDAYSLESYRRAQEAAKTGLAAEEIVAVPVPRKKGDPEIVDTDEEPFAAPLEKIAGLKPAFKKDGSVTAANSSKINDGAAALVVTSAEAASRHGHKPLARIVAYTGVAQAPEWFTTAPVGAIGRLLEKTGLTASDVDLFEINEAFAAVALAAIRELDLDPAKVNVRGGAVALGHPIGASGARILTTLVHALRHAGKRRGVAAICIGGGEATAMLVETA